MRRAKSSVLLRVSIDLRLAGKHYAESDNTRLRVDEKIVCFLFFYSV